MLCSIHYPVAHLPLVKALKACLSIMCILMLGSCVSASAQAGAEVRPLQSSQALSSFLPDAPEPQANDTSAVTLRNTPIHILKDQRAIWTSPLHIRTHDLVWLVPLAGSIGAGIATDHHVMSSVVSHDPGFNQANVNVSNVLVGSIVILPAAFYGYGHFEQDNRASETGLLGAEALGDGVIVEQAMKLIFWRERPYVDGSRGLFFQGSAGFDSSFPSSHSLLSWTTAAIIAGEYPSRWTQLGVYSAASAVSVTRVLGQEHFPTDVLVGGAAGWLIGHYVYRTRHNHTRGLREKSHGSN